MVYLILISFLAGSFLTLILQFLLLYRRKPEPVPRTVQNVNPVLHPHLKDYLSKHIVTTCQLQQQDAPAAAPPKQQESSSTKQQDTVKSKAETCNFLNAVFLFLFRELRSTAGVRRWVTKKIKVEFEELLQTKTAGRLLEGLSLRDISLGDSLPVFKTVKLLGPVLCNDSEMPEELNFEVEVEYNGGFHMAIDVDLVFGKSAYLFVKLTKVTGRLNLQFTRIPFTHWSFSFLEDPFIDFEVKSQFEGRPMPQLTSVIVNQLKRVIKKKHTLPNYKIRYKPFFPFQVQPAAQTEEPSLSIQDTGLIEGRLKVTLVECSRLFIFGSYDRETSIHCTLELSSTVWKQKTRSSIKTQTCV
ncbi:PDZ domain-containing protein 8-like [Protopterus annectens]|uniref:PDZ domain-containing protein 8-like n=1 Tax=Protopterus annectens TaxID=7888 RepID=UPI001CFB6FA8|nr:PDZ domain-containing protein 8-like [Protopterus annectens]